MIANIHDRASVERIYTEEAFAFDAGDRVPRRPGC